MVKWSYITLITFEEFREMFEVGDLVEDRVLGTYGIVIKKLRWQNGVPFYRVRWFDSYCLQENVVGDLLILKGKKT